MAAIGVYFSTVTRSRVIKSSGPAVFHGLWILNTVSAVTYSVINSGTSVSPLTATPTDILVPRNVKATNAAMTEIIKSDVGFRCPDGLYLFFPGGGISSVTAVVAFR
ncbi:MAG: hypothetical protein ACW99G_23795 [Candidatus Thorarchaeota archaeon]|jgi:hypothetical protein